MPNIRWLLALITTVHRFLYRATNGRIGTRAGRAKMLLLTNVGRKTGRRYETPLLYVENGNGWVVVASNAGDERHPAWWLNLKAHPEAEIQIGPSHHSVRAREATPEEAETLWPRLLRSYRYYTDYRTRTKREIPVILLEQR
jgi:deazaflavin-dependent oxidoreductase (nitroreductase family)